MDQKEQTKTFMMISNLSKAFGLHGLYKNKFSALRVKLMTLTVCSLDTVMTFTWNSLHVRTI